MLRIFIVIIFTAVLLLKTSCVFGNSCDCELVKNVLTNEIFDLKIENIQLTSRMDKIEALLDSKTFEMNPSTELDTERGQLIETRISAIESKIQETTGYSNKLLQLHILVAKGLRAEKSERLRNEQKIEAGLKKINDSLKEFSLQSDAIFQSLKIKTSDHIRDIKSDMSQSIASVRNDVAGISYKVTGLEHQTNGLHEKRMEFAEETMAAIKQDFSRMESDVDAIIDMVILDQKAICQPNCTNDGVCFKDNVCKCKPLTDGTRCEIAICDDKCSENGGECISPGICKCPEGLSGPNCNKINCVVPNDIDDGLSMTDVNRISLHGRDVIESKTFVYFNCLQNDELIYEPSNRRFQCLEGSWTEADSDSSWQLGNNGDFPNCREGHHKKCFDAGHSWLPKWSDINALEGINVYFPGAISSSSDCQQACLNQSKITSKSVYYFAQYKSCWCLAVSDQSYFKKNIYYPSKTYLRSC